jgi:hypothetical protein
MIAAGVSLYYQQKIELAAIHKGVSVDYHEISGSLKPLLSAFGSGITLLLVSAVLHFVKSLLLFFSAPNAQTPNAILEPSSNANGTRLKEDTKREESTKATNQLFVDSKDHTHE